MKVIILCGGIGENLWPISRTNLPKQFSKLILKKSLFQSTLELWSKVTSENDLIAVAPKSYKFFIKSQSIEIFQNQPITHIEENEQGGTLKAISLALLSLIRKEVSNNEIIVITNSDQIWKVNEDEFKREIQRIISNYFVNKIVSLGTSRSKQLKDGIEYEETEDRSFLKLSKFTKSSDLYNIGVYIGTLGTLTETIQKVTFSSLESIIEKEEFNGMRFEDVIQKAENVLIRDTKFEVIDIDNINDLSLFIEKDKLKNYFQGDVVLENCNDVTAISTKRLLVVNSVKGLNIIETPDVVYISNKKSDNSFINKLKGREELETSVTSYRPWGSYTVIDRGENYQIKKIIVNPGESLSLQLHYHRSEHWVVIKGTAKVTIDDRVIYLRENESTFIPKTSKHRLENPGKIPLEIIEIQIGEYISESDIVRFQDIYGRTE